MSRVGTAKNDGEAGKKAGRLRRSQIPTRTTDETRAKLDAAAAANGRSLTQEIEQRLERSIAMDELRGDPMTARLVEAIAAELAMVERWTGKHWHDDEVTFNAAREATRDLFARFAPPSANEDELRAAIDKRVALTRDADALRQRLKPLGALPVVNALLAYTLSSEPGRSDAHTRNGHPRDAESYERMASYVEGGKWTPGQGEAVSQELREAIAADLRRLGKLEADLFAAEAEEEKAWEPHDRAVAEGARLVREHRERLHSRLVAGERD